jgi:zinc transport system substrate-binding protein
MIMKNYKKILFFILLAVLIPLFLLFSQDKEVKDTRPMVAVSTFSLYDITKHIAQKTVKIVNIIPFGVDPHSFEPTPKLMAEIEKSQLVLYSGAGLEPWIHGYKFKNASVDMSKHVRLRTLDADEFEHHKHHDHQCAHNDLDPHYWLDFANMQKSAEVITQELIKIAPENENLYLQNRDKYIAMLNQLNSLYNSELKSCKLDTIIVNHNAYGYLSHRFGFHVEALSGLIPEAQPNAKNMSRVIKEIQKHGTPLVFVESFVSSKAMKNIANEVKVDVDTLQPLGNITADEAKQSLSYEVIMKQNLAKISKALMCR